ncbi:MAG: SsrA-binding protein SmpB [Treponemataceae bacterium]|nr:SsrA-binding protein SmpB [Treponemataceae bacterium]
MAEHVKIIAQNKKARFNYAVEDTYECGIVLEGTEVKSVKAGNISFPDAFAEITDGEVWVRNLHIAEYPFSSVFNHNPDRKKKLLLHKEEIKRLRRKVEEKGYTLIPLDFYLKDGRVKVTLGVCKGKKLLDKRAYIKERDVNREIARAFRNDLQR